MIALSLALAYLGTLAFVAFTRQHKPTPPATPAPPSLEPRLAELEGTVSELSLLLSQRDRT